LYQVKAKLKPGQLKFDENKFAKHIDTHEILQDNFLRQVLEYMLRRSRLMYGYGEILHYLCHCMCLKRRGFFLSNRHLEKKHLLYEKGVKKLEKELDIVNLVRSIRQLKLMASVLIGPSERLLLKFQKKNMIETQSSSEDSDHHKHDTIKLLNSNKPLVKL
jgi:hypothetical protein